MHAFIVSGHVFSYNQTRVIKCQLHIAIKQSHWKIQHIDWLVPTRRVLSSECFADISEIYQEMNREERQGNGEVISFFVRA